MNVPQRQPSCRINFNLQEWNEVGRGARTLVGGCKFAPKKLINNRIKFPRLKITHDNVFVTCLKNNSDEPKIGRNFI